MAYPPPVNITAAERAARSVFVGNIPYEATEEQLKEIFSQAGPVVSFRIVYDRENGKPKGYGFCEYQDLETAQSAIRNLNCTDFNGRPLRVGAAAGEQAPERAPMQQALGGPIMEVESPYGDPVEPHEAPEAISRAVASLPPEQMYELMKQMKECIQNNPGEARKMLLQNPQLAYALLQAQIVMKIVDPQVALAMLHRDRDSIPPVKADESAPVGVSSAAIVGNNSTPVVTSMINQAPAAINPVSAMGGGIGGGMMNSVGMNPMNRMGMGGMNPGMGMNPMAQPMNPMLRGGMLPSMGNRLPMGNPMPGNVPGPMNPGMSRPQGAGVMNQPPMGAQRPMGAAPPGGAGPGGDEEKAQLIMQVLQLSDEQIAMLPPDQRESILILKQQISAQKPV